MTGRSAQAPRLFTGYVPKSCPSRGGCGAGLWGQDLCRGRARRACSVSALGAALHPPPSLPHACLSRLLRKCNLSRATFNYCDAVF